MPRKVKAKGGDMWEDLAKAVGKTEPVKADTAKGAGLKKTTAKGRKGKQALVAHEVLLKELAKVKAPVKSQRKANKKQDALDIRDFVSKVKAKDQVTQLLEGIQIKRALDAQYKKMSDKANEKLKKDILDSTTKSKDTEIREKIKAEELKVITDKRDAELLVLDEAKYQRQLQRDRLADVQKERRQLTLQDQRQRDIEDREEVRYQNRQMLKDTRPRGRPIGAYSTMGAIEDAEGNYDGTYSIVSREDLVRDAKALGVSSKGDKEAIARRILSKKSDKEEAEELIGGLEDLANMPHRPKLAFTADLLAGTKLKGVDEEGMLPKSAPAPAKALPPGAPPMNLLASLKAGKKLKKTEASGVLDTSAADAAAAALKADAVRALEEIANRPKPSRANKSYSVETVEGMIAELKHRKIDIPARTKLVYVKGNPTYPDIPLSDYKRLLFAEMQK